MKRSPSAIVRSILMLVVALTFTSCLSTAVTFDVSDTRTTLRFAHTIERAVWDLGVFDAQSPERAIPVSERDAEETAGLYRDVDLTAYDIEVGADTVRVEVEYTVGSAESLAGLWGEMGGRRLSLSETGIRIPLAAGVGTVDEDQRSLIEEMFRDQVLQVQVRAPGSVTSADAGDVPVSTTEDRGGIELTMPMGDLMTAPNATVLTVDWEG